MTRIVTVFNANGTQGLSVVNAILEDGTFVPRAVTRDDTSPASQALRARGAEVVKADWTDSESLYKAIEGSEAVFLVRSPLRYSGMPDIAAHVAHHQATLAMVPQPEMEQAQKIVEASKRAGIKFFVFSTLPNVSEESGGTLTKVDFFDVKARIADWIKNEASIPCAFVVGGYFLENAWKFRYIQPHPTDPSQINYHVTRTKPSTVKAFTWAERDIGEATLALLKNYQSSPEEIIGQKFYALCERRPMSEFLEILSQGKRVNYVHVETTGIPAIDQIGDFHVKFGFYTNEAVPDPRLLKWGAKFRTIEEWAIANKERLLAAVNAGGA